MRNFFNLLAVALFALTFTASLAHAQQPAKDNPWVDQSAKMKVFTESNQKGTWVKPSGFVDAKERNNPRFFVTGADMSYSGCSVNKENGHIIIGIKSTEDNRGLQFKGMDNCDIVVLVPVGNEVAEFPVTEADELIPCNSGLIRVVIRNPKGLVEKVGKKK